MAVDFFYRFFRTISPFLLFSCLPKFNNNSQDQVQVSKYDSDESFLINARKNVGSIDKIMECSVVKSQENFDNSSFEVFSSAANIFHYSTHSKELRLLIWPTQEDKKFQYMRHLLTIKSDTCPAQEMVQTSNENSPQGVQFSKVFGSTQTTAKPIIRSARVGVFQFSVIFDKSQIPDENSNLHSLNFIEKEQRNGSAEPRAAFFLEKCLLTKEKKSFLVDWLTKHCENLKPESKAGP